MFGSEQGNLMKTKLPDFLTDEDKQFFETDKYNLCIVTVRLDDDCLINVDIDFVDPINHKKPVDYCINYVCSLNRLHKYIRRTSNGEAVLKLPKQYTFQRSVLRMKWDIDERLRQIRAEKEKLNKNTVESHGNLGKNAHGTDTNIS